MGWSENQIESPLTEAPAEGTLITTVTFGEEDETVYAVWASDIDEDGTPDYSEDKYTLTYATNGGEGGPGTTERIYINQQTVELATPPKGSTSISRQ